MTLSVSEAVARRHSCRAFLPDPVPEETVRELLSRALQAPSGGNLQPWRIIAVAGEEKDALTPLAQSALFKNPEGEDDEYPVYPKKLGEPFRTRRFRVGEDLYGAIGIPREDKAGRYAQLAENFRFFGAPVGLFFVTRREFGHGQWAHLGMLMQTIALLAEEAGLATCMQEAWGKVRETLHGHFGLDEAEVIYCGMALGHEDKSAPINNWRSERASLEDVAEFRGF
ncbi:nitroreductase [Parvularcula lutaonensis]|uniref:Nitroreductase n=1 Tax=Parvularcula lutaonensis TaxID=491923 RepID=A0ABV7M8I3_9PROT|nr:nitroreductase [Parvularcula lutaonensis]GGY44375.1 NADH dehydrogenase [Parvularcula lutaonensis]